VHDTRHTWTSLLAALDVHPRVAMAILRHAQISITVEVYTNSRELHQLGEKAQVTRSRRCRNRVRTFG